MGIIDKRQMSEEDIKLRLITPALMAKGWHGKIAMEKQITDGRVKLVGDMATREAPKRADYVLYLRRNYPLRPKSAIIANGQ